MLEKTSKLIKSSLWPDTITLTNCTVKCHIYSFSELLQGWWLHHFSGEPLPMLNHCQWNNSSSYPTWTPTGTTWSHFLLPCSLLFKTRGWLAPAPHCPSCDTPTQLCHLQLDCPQNWALGDTSSDWPTGFSSIPMEVTGFIQRLITLACLTQELGSQRPWITLLSSKLLLWLQFHS